MHTWSCYYSFHYLSCLTFLFFELSILRLPTQHKSNCRWYSCTYQQLAMASDGDARVWKSFLWRFTSGSLLGGDSSSLCDWKNSICCQDKVAEFYLVLNTLPRHNNRKLLYPEIVTITMKGRKCWRRSYSMRRKRRRKRRRRRRRRKIE